MSLLIVYCKQLCATGTVGAAAIGFAFGRSKDPNTKRPISHKRRASDRPFLDSCPFTGLYPTTPLIRPHSVAALTTDFRKSDGSGQYIRSALATNGETKRPASSIADGDGSSTAATQTTNSSTADSNRSGNQRPSWLRRMSTMSSFHYESPVSTPRPDSSSLSLSNGSTGPILATNPYLDATNVPRNKLVKRTTSQRALQGDRSAHSTLRRPATSHQRSATLMQQNLTDDAFQHYGPTQSKSSNNPFSRSRLPSDATVASWRPFFKSRPTGDMKEGSSRKRNAAGKVSKHESVRCINPQADDLPTLLLATSITPRYSDVTSSDSIPVDTIRSFTPVGLDASTPPSAGRKLETEPNSRPSFSLSEMFPSPSPSTWKIARSGSLRKSKKPDGLFSGRRISSAPQIAKSRREPSHEQDETPSRPHTTSAGHMVNGRFSSSPQNEAVNVGRSALSSPLSPVHQLSTTEINLPGDADPHPTNERYDMSPPFQPISAHISPRVSSPTGATTTRRKSDRQSSARSDLASTLVGYDTDNSRFLSGDEDDIDYRSETVFDSTRTGGTSNSHSNVRGPRIDTIFQEPTPSDLRKTKLLTLQDMLPNGTFTNPDSRSHGIVEEEESVSTPVRTIASIKNLDQSTPIIAPQNSSWSADDSSLPITYSVNLLANQQRQVTPNLRDDEIWSFDDIEDESHNRIAESFDPVDPVSSTQHNAALSVDESTTQSQGRRDQENSESDSQINPDTDLLSGPKPQIVQGRWGQERRNSRASGRRGPSALHVRSQSVPIPPDPAGHRNYTSTSKLESWVLGSKGVSEDWDNDFDFEEPSHSNNHQPTKQGSVRPSNTSGMLVPRSIMDRQASVHGQFGQVKELTLLVEDLKRLRQQAITQGILQGQSAELWKEAEGIVNLATLDDEDQEFLDPRSPRSPSLDLDPFEEDSLAGPGRRRSGFSPPKEHRNSGLDHNASSHSSPHVSLSDTPPTSRPRKESAAKVKSVLETIHKRRPNFEPALMDEDTPQKKLPFDTTSLRDLVTRAGVVTRALKEIVRRAESVPATPEPEPLPRDPLFSQMFHQPSNSPSFSKTPRASLTGNSPDVLGRKSPGNDSDVNGHRKIMTIV